MRSIPEKTLEHWTGIYLSNRFPRSSLWWPTSGEDVLVSLPWLAATGPGQTLALELKTTEALPDGSRHKLSVDTAQLDRYLRSSFPLSVYYVFPIPHWTGSLDPRGGVIGGALAGGEPTPPAWWRKRSGRAWFADWLYVLPALSVDACLLRSRWKRQATLFETGWWPPGVAPDWDALLATSGVRPVPWREFWVRAGGRAMPWGTRWSTVIDAAGVAQGRLRLSVSVGDDTPEVLVLDPADVAGSLGRAGSTDTTTGDGTEHAVVHIPERRRTRSRR